MTRRILSLLALALGAAFSASAQGPLQINLAFSPPYSPYFSDYLSFGNKALLTISNTSGQPVDVFFRGSITGDNGVSGSTKGDFRPAVPNTISGGPAPTILRGPDFESYFNFSNFNLQGITTRELLTGSGLPEGNYTVCLQAFDFATGQPVSNNACFILPILYPEPPVPMMPLCESIVLPNPAQQITFTWSPSPGAPPGTRYVLKVVELLPGQVPYDAINTITTPPFFETETRIPTYTYRLSDPVLTPGKRYAWAVTAFDPARQVLFRNNGRSPVCTFSWGGTPVVKSLTTTAPSELYLSSPNCKTTDSLVIGGAENNLAANWFWEFQNTPALAAKAPDSAMSQKIGSYLVRYKPLQRIGVNKTKPVGLADPEYTTAVPAGAQALRLPVDSFAKSGLRYDHWYAVSVAALNPAGSVIATSKACEIRLVKPAAGKDSATFTGVLVYRLEPGGPAYPAANLPIKGALRPNPFHGLLPAVKYSDYAAAITDSNGKFTFRIPVTADKAKHRYLDITHTSGYLAQRAKNIPLDSFQNFDAARIAGGVKDVRGGDEVSFGEVAVDAYSYDLTVRVTKGFPTYYYDTVSKNYKSYPIYIDTLSINPKVKVKAGIPVALYRKTKAGDIPWHEASTRIIGPAGNGKGALLVAKGVTSVINAGTTGERTVVVFKNLLCNRTGMNPEDVYYMQALLHGEELPGSGGSGKRAYGTKPSDYKVNTQGLDALLYGTPSGAISPNINSTATSTAALSQNPGGSGKPVTSGTGSIRYGGTVWDLEGKNYSSGKAPSSYVSAAQKPENEEDYLEAPEQLIAFPQTAFKTGQTKYTLDTTYRLISTVPPMSEISGKMVYEWPSAPGVKRPLANVKFRVVVRHLYNGKLGFPYGEKGACKGVFTSVQDAKAGQYFDPSNDGVTVGVGETDAAGNYKLRIVNYDQKGLLTTSAKITTVKFDCGPPPKTGKDKGTLVQEIKDMWQPHDPGMGIDALHYKDQFTTLLISEQGLAVNALGQSPTGTLTGNINTNNLAVIGGPGGVTAATVGGLTGGTGGVKAKGSKKNQNKGGPADDAPEDWAAPPDEEESGTETTTVSVERRLFFELEAPYTDYYKDPQPASGLGFVVDAFATKDLGVYTSTVKELTGNVQVRVVRDSTGKNGKSYPAAVQPQLLNNTKLVVFRYPDQKKPSYFPAGEGTDKHPLKPLISGSMLTETSPSPVEWIIENGFSVGTGGTFAVSNKALLDAGDYYIQVAADPGKEATRIRQHISGFQRSVDVWLDKARIQGRVVEYGADKPIAGATVDVAFWTSQNATSPAKTIKLVTDQYGYFQLTHGDVVGGVTAGFNPQQYISVTPAKTGYKYTLDAAPKEFAPDFGVQKSYSLALKPGGILAGRVVDGSGGGVESYILRLPDSSIYSTYSSSGKGGFFKVPVPQTGSQTISIIPLDPAYFDTTLTVANITASWTDLKEIPAPRRQHRMRFRIQRLDIAGNPVQTKIPGGQFRISINNGQSLVNAGGDTAIQFAAFSNVSVNNYSILITDALNSGYIPQTVEVKNAETRGYVDYAVAVKMGGSVTGIVKLGSTPVKGAKVFVEQSAWSNGGTGYGQSAAFNELTTTTDGSGRYTLRGLEATYTNSTTPMSHNVWATLDSAGLLVQGQKKIATINKDGLDTLDFTLTKVADATLASVWGYPVTVTEAQYVDPTSYLVSGYLDLATNKTEFKFLDPKSILHFKKALFRKEKDAGGKSLLVPAADSIALVEAGVKLKFKDRYNVAISGSPVKPTAPLILSKGGAPNKGKVIASARIVDNSYNYPSTYLDFSKTGSFFLATYDGGKLTPTVPAISNLTQVTKTVNLSDSAGGPLKFTFIGFPATAEPKTSTIDVNGRVHLDMTMKGKIPNSMPGTVDISIPDLVLDQAKIDVAAGQYPLKAKLGDWTLEVPKWTVDPQKGGIYSEDAVIKTGVADLKMKRFNLRKDLFVLDQFSPEAGITLGGGNINLENVMGTATLVFDPKVGSDGGAHWRFNLTAPPGGAAATFSLGKTSGNKTLSVGYMQLISYNDENIVVLNPPATDVPVGNNPYIHWRPTSISPNKDFFVLTGPATFDVPRMPSMTLTMEYTKKGGELAGTLQSPPAFGFDGPGYVKYVNDKAKPPFVNADARTVKFYGTIAEPGRMDPIPCTFNFGQGNKGSIILEKNRTVKLTDKANLVLLKDSVVDGVLVNGMKVEGTDWGNLRYTGLFKETGNAVLSGTDTLGFTVLGEITASSKSIKASEIQTPFGNMNMVFDFGTGELTGTMRMDNMAFGSWYFTGDVEVRAGKNGFLSMAAGQLNTGTLLVEGFGTFSSGLVLGAYNLDEPIIKKTVQFSKDPAASCWLTQNASKFRGFYFTGGYDILNKSEGFDIGIASVYLKAVLGVEASLGVNLGGSGDYMLGVGAHGMVKAGASAITGTTVNGEFNAHLTAQANYKGAGGYKVDGKSDINVSVEACQYVPWPVDEDFCISASKGAGATFQYAKGSGADFDFFLYNPGTNVQCSK